VARVNKEAPVYPGYIELHQNRAGCRLLHQYDSGLSYKKALL